MLTFNQAILVSALSLVSAAVGGGAVILSNWISRKTEERKHLREMATQAAIAEWSKIIDIQTGPSLYIPLAVYVFAHMRAIDRAFSGGKMVSDEEILRIAKDSRTFSDRVMQELK